MGTMKLRKLKPLLFLILVLTLLLTSCLDTVRTRPYEDESEVRQAYSKDELIEAFPAYSVIFDDVDLEALYDEIMLLLDDDIEWLGEGRYICGINPPSRELLILADPPFDDRPEYSTSLGYFYPLPGIITARNYPRDYSIKLTANSRMVPTSEIPEFSLAGRSFYHSGTYRVGSDIEPGIYFYILNHPQHEDFNSLLVRGGLHIGAVSYNTNFGYIKVSEEASSVECNDYILVPLEHKPDIEIEAGVPLPAGMYHIGADIPEGNYKIEQIKNPSGYRSGPADYKDFIVFTYLITEGPFFDHPSYSIDSSIQRVTRPVEVYLSSGQYINLVNCTITLLD